MTLIHWKELKESFYTKLHWNIPEKSILVIFFIFILLTQGKCQIIHNESSHIESFTKKETNNKAESKHCHNCNLSSIKSSDRDNDYLTSNYKHISSNSIEHKTGLESPVNRILRVMGTFIEKKLEANKLILENNLEKLLDRVLNKDRYEIVEGIEIKPVNNSLKIKDDTEIKGRALFSSYTYEYRIFQKIKNFINTHIISVDFPKAAERFRTFGLRKFLLPLVIGIQIFKAIVFALFLPSLLGSFGKILAKGLSHISTASSQASYPPVSTDDQTGYNNENKDFMGYESDPAGTYAYPQDTMYPNVNANEINDLGVDLSRFGMGGQKATYLPSNAAYYKNQMAASGNNYKVFQKIPSSSMILSNYDPFYSPLLSRLDGIFSRLGLAPSENSIDSGAQTGGQGLSDAKLEACREQLICLMYASPAKYAPYSNLVSAQLSRELNELRRPVSDNPEILRFFRYMRAARRGQEGIDCIRAHPACAATATPAHTMIAAYHDINKLVTARKLQK